MSRGQGDEMPGVAGLRECGQMKIVGLYMVVGEL
jgi:hypothetical protein